MMALQGKPLPQSKMSARPVQITGHRGAAGLAPENTLAAFRKAIELRLDAIEFDVQRTTDGYLVVFHDDELDRVTNGKGLMRERTLASLKALDAGSWFNKAFKDERIPTLHELFNLMRDNDLLLYLEMKDPSLFPGMEEEVAALIREYGFTERCCVRSFDHASLHRFHRVAPEIPISELWYTHFPSAEETTYPTLNMMFSLCTADHVAAAHARGQKVTCWTVNEIEDARRLIDMGVDGLTGDYPDRLIALF